MLTFTVYGVAQSKGSTRAFTLKGMKHPIITDSNRNAKAWQQLVAEAANQALQTDDARQLLCGPVALTVAFRMPRPKKYQKPNRPVFHCTKPDIDKLLRAVLDALTGVVFVDDSQIVTVIATKQYAAFEEAPHIQVTVDGVPT